MNPRIDPSMTAVLLVAALFLITRWHPRNATIDAKTTVTDASHDNRLNTHSTATVESFPRLRPIRPKPTDPSPSRDYLNHIIATLRDQHDPATRGILEAIEHDQPGGWAETFILHDALVASGALTDLARIFSFASSSGLERQPRKTLSGDALHVVNLADAMVRKWLVSKYPLLGDTALERIMQVPNIQALPLLGQYNLITEEEAIQRLGITVRPQEKHKKAPLFDSTLTEWGR